ncbi:thermonuclease family protein [Candidatus Woesearchaeota archaeon]|nr:thermonuclease family protein [Candidatus Woesearchaeota archaeon]
MSYNARAIGVTDGDTFTVDRSYNNIDIIRLNGVDTPEKGEPGYTEAKIYLASLILGKTVTIEPVSIGPFRRVIANVYLNGISINKKIKEKGW